MNSAFTMTRPRSSVHRNSYPIPELPSEPERKLQDDSDHVTPGTTRNIGTILEWGVCLLSDAHAEGCTSR